MSTGPPSTHSRSHVPRGSSGPLQSIVPAKRPASSKRSVISISSGDEDDGEAEDVSGPSISRWKNVGVDYKKKYEDLKKTMAQTVNGKAEKSKDQQIQELQNLLSAREQELEALKKQPVPTSSLLETKLVSIRTAMQCQICFDLLQRPFAINPCGHEFCSHCLKDWLTRSRAAAAGDAPREYECPSCRTLTRLRPIKMYLLQSIADMLKTANESPSPTKHRNAAPIDEETFWQGLFDVADKHDPALRMDPPGLVPMDVNIGPGVGPGRWVDASYVPTPLGDVPGINNPNLSDEHRALLRRGATLAMIEELELSYNGLQGITGNLGEYHMHFGWIMHRNWSQVHDADVAIQVAMIQTPERFTMTDGCIYERVWIPL